MVIGTFDRIREVEVARVFAGVARRKAAGDDGLVAEMLQQAPSLVKTETCLFNMILKTGRFPDQMLQAAMVPLGKPNRGPEICGSKRPTSLTPAVSRALEAVVLHGLVMRHEAVLDSRQYAYRRERGTGMRLLELSDFARASRNAGKYVHVASIDAASAFDAVPHSQLIRTAQEWGIDP